MTAAIVIEPGTIVGNFEVICRAENTKRGDARFVVRCRGCRHELVKRGTEIRQVARGDREWRCKCQCEERESRERVRKAESFLVQRIRDARREYKERNIYLYYTWCSMIARCNRKTHPKFKHYGARGISVCDEWRHNFKAFCEWSLAHGYRRGLTIDRRDNYGGYSPDNCRWVTYSVQENNKRTREQVLADLKKAGYI